MERKIEFSEDEFYHVYNRGVDKRNIFGDYSDYCRFMKSLYLHNNTEPVEMSKVARGVTYQDVFLIKRAEQLVDIGAYCLMPNHFHLLLKEKTEHGISRFLKKIETSHSMFFNKKYERSGSLFQGNFKATHIDSDEYLNYLYCYIHLNPIKIVKENWRQVGIGDISAAKEYLLSYGFSSYLDYVGKERTCKSILNKEAFPEYFENSKDFESFIDDWVRFEKDEELNLFDSVIPSPKNRGEDSPHHGSKT